MKWINVKERLPENLQEVIVTWVNHEPDSYYEHIKDVPMTGFAVFHRGKWYWASSTTKDMLAEYGEFEQEEIDECIEVIAWMATPEPYDETLPTLPDKENAVKPILKDRLLVGIPEFVCPTCKLNFSGFKVVKYCYHCGQKIDWSEYEEPMDALD